MSDLPYRDKIRHDDCSEIIEAWRSGRLIDREAIDYFAATNQMERINWELVPLETPPRSWLIAETRAIVDAALGLDKETTT